MNQSRPAVHCEVIGADKLPAEAGGSDALCAAIVEAAAAQGVGSNAHVAIRVLSPSGVAAVATTADGKALPEQRMASSDRPLTQGAFERFAIAIAAQLAGAGAK